MKPKELAVLAGKAFGPRATEPDKAKMAQIMQAMEEHGRQLDREKTFLDHLTTSMLSFIAPAKTMKELYDRLDIHHKMTVRGLKLSQGKRQTVFGHQWRERVYSDRHPGRVTRIAMGLSRAIEMIRAEYRNEIPTLHREDIIK